MSAPHSFYMMRLKITSFEIFNGWIWFKQYDFNFLIDEKSWKKLLRYSGSEEKRNISIVSKLIGDIIRTNLYQYEEHSLPNIMLGASLGVIFQEDGFRKGLEFGAWLGSYFNGND